MSIQPHQLLPQSECEFFCSHCGSCHEPLGTFAGYREPECVSRQLGIEIIPATCGGIHSECE